MDLDAAIIGLAIKNEESLKSVREAGVDADLLLKQGKAAWLFVHDYQSIHGKLPPPFVIKEQTGLDVMAPEDGLTIAYVADHLHERAIYRALEYGLDKGMEHLSKGEQEEATSEVLKLADHIREKKVKQVRVHTLGDVVDDVWGMYENTKNGVIGIPFPWQLMTDMTMGMWPGTLTFFVARPGVGKSWSIINICCHAHFECGKTILLVSPEMSRVELVERVLARHGQFNYSDVVSGTLGSFAEPQFKKSIESLRADQGFWVLDDEERLEPSYIEDAISALNPDLIGIDSVYMLRVAKGKVKSGPGARGGRYDRILETVDWMRSLSRRIKRPVLGVSQLSREGKVKKGASFTIKSGKGTGGLEDALAMTDTLFWDAHNLFAMFQDDDMKEDKQMIYVPLKARRQAKWSSVVTRWDMDEMNFEQIGSFVPEKEGKHDDGDAIF